ncbi:mucin-5AC [Marmota flaviventris]|uniref:mucin-5AC n=1 Tax=Marmota flaviventris TaxID=93162 RepID=UPI003A844EFB
MAVGRRKLAPLWALAWALACTQHTGQAQQGSLQPGREHSADLSPLPGHSGDPLLRMTDTPPLRAIPVVQALNRAHNGRVCSTWGDFHYKTFDGDIFRFPGLCNYVFSAHCGAAYEDFNVQLRRSRAANTTTLSRVIMKLDGLVIELNESSVLVNGHPVQLPFSQSGVLMERSNGNLKVTARLGLVFMWDQDDDSLLLELDSKFANQTCGLCGDFNGIPVFSEFFSHDVRLTPIEFGNLQKMDGPTEQCQDPDPAPQNCSTGSGICEELLRGQLFSGCAALVDVSSYVEACRQDLCLCEQADLPSCICHTLAEYSRQCAHAGGLPQDWRGPDLCYQTCPLNMQHQECGSPCTDTCSNPQRSQLCEDHCVAGCFCPEGTVFDDIGQTGCVPMSQCSCLYNGTSYAPGANYSTDCTHTCSGGRWSCQEVPCQGTCSVLGGSHLSTFDEKQYTVHGDCSYVLTKPCNDDAFTVLAELRRCGLTESETCLKGVELRLGGGPTAVVVKASGEVFVNQIYTQLPVSTANVTLFRPSTFFIIAQTNLGVQLAIQLVPTMQVFVRLAPELRGLTCGLCGNFNSIQADDFRTNSGVVEGTGAAFANTWKTQAACPNVKSSFEDPCSLSVENEKYAQHWCSQLTSPDGPFAQCHATVSPSTYYSNCMFDTCNCEKSEDCMCAALSSYVQACATKGVLLRGWRAGVCTKPTTTCPKSMTYHYHISTCQPTCRALSEEDVTCHVSFVPVDGCACPEGMFLDASDKCVPAASCPCYHRGSMVPNGESLHDSGAVCTCTQGTLTCIGGPAPTQVCDAPMVYVDCHNATHGATGAGCQKSCHTLDMACYSPQCEPGCVCPPGLVADGSGGCIAAEDCPCMHNGASYRPGETIWAGCNTCTCENRMWRCTEEPCLATCALYGDGHFLTFDGQRYTFSGDCQYTLVQDHCGGNGSAKDAFRVVTENVPCGTTGTTCSKDIKIFLGSYELKLSSGKVEVVQKGAGQEPPYTIRQMGIYLVVDTDAGLVLLWDRRTSIFLRLSPEFKGRVCGLCGNFDGNALNDFTTRSQAVVGDALEFGNSWKLSPSCPDAPVPKDPCTTNPYRKAWAQKQCSIIHSATFATCHAHVEPTMYYEACVGDACACDSGGDCECFCTAVAAYAQACHEAGVCVSWRTLDVCPLFCDYYNPQGECEWHFQPCGAPCMRTCRNPSGRCLHDLRGLEGCYPKCPPSAPIFDEDKMQCVDKCSTPTPPPPCRIHGKSYRPGATVPSDKNCYSCICTENGVHCAYDSGACVCTYDGRHFHPGDVIYNTTDGMGSCISAHCRANGTVERRVFTCSPTTPRPPTTFSFSTSPHTFSSRQTTGVGSSPTQSTVHSVPVSTASSTATGTPLRTTPATSPVSPSAHCGEKCLWSPWLDVSRPGQGVDSGDFDTLQNLRAHGFRVCQVPRAVECRAEDAPEVPLQALGQHLECSPTAGLTCHNRDQASGLCRNYQIRVLCCSPLPCPTSSPPATHRTTNTGASTSEGPSTASPVTTSGPGTVPTTSATVSSTPVRTSFLKSNPTPRPKTTSGTSSASASPPGTSQVTDVPTTSGISPVSCLRESCTWTQWIDGSYPGPGRDSGDFDTFHNLRSKGYKFCERPTSVECRAQFFPNTPLAELGQQVTCNSEEGLICWNRDQLPPICYNYEIRIQCCELVDYCRNETIGTPKSIATHPKSLETSATTKTTVTTGSQATSTGHTIHPTPVHTSRGTSVGTKVTQPQTTDCQPQCTWTKWFDVDFPDPGPHGGDTETYSNILSKGERICLQPEDITRLECRAENHPEVSIEALGQVVQCEPHTGLVCRNQEQQGPLGMCLNYEVRVLCCHTPKGCQTTVPVTHSSTSRETLTSQVQKTDSALTVSPSSTRETSSTSVHTVSPSSTRETSSTSVHTRETSSTSVHTVSPSSTRETTSSTSVHTVSPSSTRETSSTSVHTVSPSSKQKTSSTSVHTVSPSSTRETSSTSVHTVSPSSSGETSSTSVHTVSPSSTRETSSTSVHTVSPSSTRETSSTSVHTVSPSSSGETSSTSVHTVSPSSTRETSSTSVHTVSPSSTRETSSTSVHTVSPSSTGKTSSTPVPTSSSSHTPAPESTHSTPQTTDCQPQCTWTKWFDVDFPDPGPHGGDTETYSNILSKGERICLQPEDITRLECRAENHPEVSIEALGQVVQCEPHMGLVCRNQEQQGPLRMCLNYEVRVLCCHTPKGCQTTTSSTSVHTVSPSSTRETSSTSVHTVSPSSTRETSSTSVHTVSPSSIRQTSSTSEHTVSPSSTRETSSTSVHTVSPSSIRQSSSTSVHTVSPSSTRETSSTSVHTVSPSSIRQTSSTSVHTVSPSSTQKTSSTSVHTVSPSSTGKTSSTPVPTSSSSHTPAPESTHSTPQTTDCQPQCTWTKWFDVDFPDPGPHGGDTETYSNILSKGERICLQPEDITRLECRAENHPEVSIEALGQVVQCEPHTGLVCRNQEQQGPLRMCLNYEVRVLCCHTPKGCQTTVPVTHSSTSRETLTSQVQKTDSALTVSPSSTRETSSTSVHTVSPSSTRETSSTSVHTVSPSSTRETSSTSVHTVSPSSIRQTSSTSVHTVSPSSMRETSSTSVHTVSPSSIRQTSSTSVHTVSPSSTRETSSTSVHTKTSSTSVHTVSPSSTRETSSTSVHTVSPSSTQKTSSTSVHTVSPSSTGKTSSTPVPTSSSSHTPAPESTHSTPQTTDCQPQCTWTKWFDVDFPDPGPHGGDTETYSNILSKGERICLQPEDITRLECRAENHPEVSIEALGQVVQCEPHTGLVCRNQEQQGPLGMCLNYEVRVLCCHTPKGCQTTGTPAWTVPPEPSSSVPSTSAVASPWSPSSAPSSTLPCFCSVLDQLYPAGSIIYSQRDLSGHCYYALCSQDCEVIKGVDHDCPSTTPPPTSVSSLSMSTPETGCPNVLPPREKGESWAMPNCTQATCEGNSIISLRPRKCPEVKEPTCANGYPALKVADQDGCCQHYQCQCVCSGWGDPHYITFDGTYYTFLDNCTYVLVQQVVPVYGHFRVLINNDFCDPKDQLSCPQAIIVEYHQDRVVLTRTSVGGVMTNQIIFNNKVVSPGFQSNGIAVSRVGIKMYVTIREIGVRVMFSGLIFSVEVPFSTFANNTEGQCGTCTNDKRDECRLPGGTVAPSCSAMSGHWKVDVPGQPHCHGPTPTPPSTTPQTTPVQCPPSPLCELILSKVFQPCHHVISPQSFYEGCVFDYCHMTPLDVVCSGLQLYAALCASEGVCIDWRGHTNHACPFTCSAGQVYLPCGPSSLPYCYGKDSTSSLALPEAGPITEGCFCPENTMLFSSDAQVCVPANCSWCLGPHGEPVEPGHTISTDCQECTCKDSSQNMTCHRKPCPLPPACPLPGLVPVPTAPKAGQCCPQFVCACNTSYCPEPQHCPKGSRLVLTHEEGACCPSQICRGIGCNVNGTVYQPGAMVSSSLCERCWCEAAGSPPSGSFLVSCETQICNTHCPLGFEYQAQMGRCCGKCVAVSCVVNTPRGRGHFLRPGESWSDPENRCVTYRCEKHQDRLEVVTVEKQCAPLSCARDQARLSSDGCCFVCPHTSCMLHHRNQTIRQGSCSSAGPVRLSYCQGNCGNSTSMYSLDTYTVERKCQCCQELRTSRKKVSLTCADGSSRTFSYTQAEACGCLGQQCHSPGDTSH